MSSASPASMAPSAPPSTPCAAPRHAPPTPRGEGAAARPPSLCPACTWTTSAPLYWRRRGGRCQARSRPRELVKSLVKPSKASPRRGAPRPAPLRPAASAERRSYAGRTYNLGDDEPATSAEVAAFARAVGPRSVRKCRTAKPSAHALKCSSAERCTHCAQLLREAGERLPPVGAEPPVRARRGGGLRAMRRDNKRVLSHAASAPPLPAGGAGACLIENRPSCRSATGGQRLSWSGNRNFRATEKASEPC
jgi:hypothetical protein